MAEQQKPATGYPAASSQYPAGYPPPQWYASASNGYPPSGYPPSYYPPPPRPPPNQAYYYGESGGCSVWRFFRRLIIATIVIFVIVFALFLTIGLIFQPQTPGFSVNAVTVRQFNISGSQLTANWDVTFAVDNRDKTMAVSYGRIEASVLYNDHELAGTPLTPFQLEKRSNTTLTANFTAVSAFVSDSGKLTSERSAGQVHFMFHVWSVVQFQADGWRTRWRSLNVLCKDVEIDFPRSTTNGTEGTLKSPSGCSVQ